MKSLFIFLTCALLPSSTGFKDEQKKYSRVRQAYADSYATVLYKLQAREIKPEELRIYIQVFKQEKQVILWGKNSDEDKYQKISEFEICASSGSLGPKRQQGDYQVPEGFYHIDRFNPWSNFYLSLGINYPNRSDRILGNKSRLGGDIFIHGSCVTVGCVPLTDEFIKEFYVYCVEAKNAGQSKIPVTIFPARLDSKTLQDLKSENESHPEYFGLWEDLAKGYSYFETNRKLPSIGFLADGRHTVN